MLLELTIFNLAIIKEAHLSFSKGMTVITGETGAGKSILLDALNLVLGHRADIDLILPGQEKAEVIATFQISHLPGAVLWLNDLELNSTEEEVCIIRRILYQNGRSKAYINGVPATSQQLKLLGDYLVQMHGQHKHQLLLMPKEQLRILDAYGKHPKEVDALKHLYYEREKCLKAKHSLITSDAESEHQIALLQYQIDEIENLSLKENELALLYEEHDRLAHADGTLMACQTALSALDDETQGSALQLVCQAKQALHAFFEKQAELNNTKVCLESALIQLQETIHELTDFADHLQLNPERLHEVSQRIERIHDVARKHKIEPEHLEAHYQTLQDKLEALKTAAQSIASLDETLQALDKQYHHLAQQLTKKRQKAASRLSQEITKHIQPLAMEGAEFSVSCEQNKTDFSPTGYDEITFCISANVGHPPKPLHKIASGGELSRISLALELNALQDLPSPTLIFDEVDVGIGGKTGAIVGQCLQELSETQQVICITHLPQVAAFGDHHFVVTKQHSKTLTQTQITQLQNQERVEEIARMLGGINISGEAKAQAKHLLKRDKLTV